MHGRQKNIIVFMQISVDKSTQINYNNLLYDIKVK